MTFDEWATALHAEEFVDILEMEGKVFGVTRYNLSLDELLDDVMQYKSKLEQAKGACFCLSEDLFQLEQEVWMKVYNLFDIVDTRFIKENPRLKEKTRNELFSYSMLITGL